MRPSVLMLPLLAFALLSGGCAKPDRIELTPQDHAFGGVGEEVWWAAEPVARSGQRFPKLRADIRWKSSDQGVISVDERGRVRSVGPGQALLTASLGDLKAEARVEVIAVGKIDLRPAQLTLPARGEAAALDVKIFDTQGRLLTNRTPLLRCADEGVCRTSGSAILPVDPGATRVEVRVGDVVEFADVQVVPAP